MGLNILTRWNGFHPQKWYWIAKTIRKHREEYTNLVAQFAATKQKSCCYPIKKKAKAIQIAMNTKAHSDVICWDRFSFDLICFLFSAWKLWFTLISTPIVLYIFCSSHFHFEICGPVFCFFFFHIVSWFKMLTQKPFASISNSKRNSICGSSLLRRTDIPEVFRPEHNLGAVRVFMFVYVCGSIMGKQKKNIHSETSW